MKAPITFAEAIADETRFRVLHLTFDHWMCVCELADVLKVPQSTLSTHLQVIQRADLLKAEKKGKWMFYRVKKSFRPLLKSLFDHFDVSAKTNKTLAADASKAAKQIAARDEKCCPSPTPHSTKAKA
jgi:ArsR family transcriptional regulator